MKVRILAVFSILSLAAWLPIRAQQEPAPAAAAPDHKAMACCHGKGTDPAKTTCCEGKEAKEMACCNKSEKADRSAANCCQDMKDGQCAAKDGKDCCNAKTANGGKECCAGMTDHCAAHSGGK